MGIEPMSETWEAPVLPLYDARSLFLIVLRHWNWLASTRFASRVRVRNWIGSAGTDSAGCHRGPETNFPYSGPFDRAIIMGGAPKAFAVIFNDGRTDPRK